MSKIFVVLAFAVFCLSCGHRVANAPVASPPAPQPKPEVTVSCTPELQTARANAVAAVKAGSNEIADKCKLFEAQAGTMLGCTLDDGKFATLESDLKACHEAQLVLAMSPPLPAPTPVMQAPPQPQISAGQIAPFAIGTRVWAKGWEQVGHIGSVQGDHAIVVFTNPVLQTEYAQNVALTNLKPQASEVEVSFCGVKETISPTTVVSVGDDTIGRIVSVYPSEQKVEIEPLVRSEKWFAIFELGYDLVPATANRVVNVTDIKGLQTSCLGEICEGDKIVAVKPIDDAEGYGSRGYSASRVFCDGTLAVRAFNRWGTYKELVYQIGQFQKSKNQ